MPPRPPSTEPRPVGPPSNLRLAARLGGFHHEVGFRIDPEASRRGLVTVTGRVERRHLNINGVVHGGVYATILDTAMGASVVSLLAEGETTATTSLYVEFLRAAREGALLSAQGEVLRRGRHIAFAEGNLYDGDGRRLSQARGTWYIWSPDEATPAPARPADAPRSKRRRA
ncbi:MAG TPA: hotdog fold thioesterase [Thermoplasmata archaeon]|nr:hotdog fold thioesterase [Thermoplasmata archaeon]